MNEVLLRRTEDRVQVLTLNRPDARNALSGSLVVALHEALVAADADDDTDVVVLTGADPAFCAGVDLKEAAQQGESYFRLFDDHDCVAQVAKVRKPVIGAVNGATFTGGLEIALGCDFLIASERAYFADTHVRVGVLPGGGLTVRLPQAVGLRRAMEMSMTGEIVDAATAWQIGLVNHVVPHDQLLEQAMRAARAVTEPGPGIVGALKHMYKSAAALSGGDALVFERRFAHDWQVDMAGLAGRSDAVRSRNREQVHARTPDGNDGDNS